MLGPSSAVLLADSGEEKKAGPLALAVVLVLAIACYFLFRSMTRHLRKVRTQFPSDQPAEPKTTSPSPDEAADADSAPTVTPADRPASTDPPG